MDCSLVRESISAELDGEISPLARSSISEHLARCSECNEWHSAASVIHREARIAPAEEIPDLTSAILVTLGDARDSTRADSLRACRWILAVCALLQLSAAVPSLFEHAGDAIHLNHELGSWDIGLAFGFLVCALQPKRAWGMLPLLFVVGTALGITSFIDIVDGTVSATRECVHITELLGFIFTWMVARFSAPTQQRQFAFS
jgi:predicted anti-sigma-YlaC factor YlaD